ncbi:MAG: cation:proton antiporter [Acidobacteria bacterium]|nr:cation:proton antiporter [Acidobacteriota bacterium]
MRHELPLFKDLLIPLLASIPIAFLCHRLRLPAIVGFMVTGIMIGPSAFGLIKDVHAIEFLAEIGVALLLFTIGLEFSLKSLMGMKRLVLGAGGGQVVLTVLMVMGLVKLTGRPFSQALFYGFLLALSSTAIVMKSYADRLEIDTIHGRAGIGILLFQDLCIVPMMLLTPILSGQQGATPATIALTLGKAAAVIVVIIFAARTVVPFLLYRVVMLRSSEVFIIFVVLVSLGTAWVTSRFGLSMALGAFLAGIILSESEYSHQIVSDILPFRDVFNSIFFISIGMLLSLTVLIESLPIVMSWLAAIILIKMLIVAAVVRLLGYSMRISVTVGLGLAQVGEFSFILAKLGNNQSLIGQIDYQIFLAASILSMIATPFLIQVAPLFGQAIQSRFNPGRMPTEEEARQDYPAHKLNNHVVVVGYGMNGRNLSKVLHRTGIPFIVLELNAETVRTSQASGIPVYFGDVGRQQVLQHFGIAQAAIMVLAISDPLTTRRAVALARELNPNLHIIVRTRYMSEVTGLFDLGASEVIPEEFETSIEIFSRVLKQYGISRNVIENEVLEIRKEGYEMLRSTSLPVVETNRLTEAFAASIADTIYVQHDSPSVGKTLKDLDLRHHTGVTVTAIVRAGIMDINPGPEFSIEAEDILVLIGKTECIDQAIDYVKNGVLMPRSKAGNLTLTSETP